MIEEPFIPDVLPVEQPWWERPAPGTKLLIWGFILLAISAAQVWSARLVGFRPYVAYVATALIPLLAGIVVILVGALLRLGHKPDCWLLIGGLVLLPIAVSYYFLAAPLAAVIPLIFGSGFIVADTCLAAARPPHVWPRGELSFVVSQLAGALGLSVLMVFINFEYMSLHWRHPMGIKLLTLGFGLMVVANIEYLGAGLLLRLLFPETTPERKTTQLVLFVFLNSLQIIFVFIPIVLLIHCGPAAIQIKESFGGPTR